MRRLIAILVALLLAVPAAAQQTTFAYPGIGTSGATVPLLNGANTWSSLQTLNAGATLAINQQFRWGGGTRLFSSADNDLVIENGGNNQYLELQLTGANAWNWGQPNAASTAPQTIGAQGSRGGTDTNAAGASVIYQSGTGTGNATGSTFTIKTPHAGSTGSVAQTMNAQITVSDNLVAINQIASDATHTDSTVCQDTTTHNLYAGSGTLGICLGTSSARFKHGIAPLAPGLAEIMRLRPVSYYLNAGHGDPAKQLYGFTAEDMRPVLPKLVGLDAGGNPSSADYLGLVPVLVKAVQEQQAEIEALKRQIANDNVRLASAGAR